MNDYCVVVADAARARMFVLGESGGVGGGPDLSELGGLANPEGEAAGKALYSDTKSGRNDAPAGGGAHGYDDHRDRHMAELERRFARDILMAARDELGRRGAHTLVLAAGPRMLGYLREAMEGVPEGVTVREVGKDLTRLSPAELHQHLAADGVLPPRQSADSQRYTPAGQTQ